jgi:CSLREA domain-containing protein
VTTGPINVARAARPQAPRRHQANHELTDPVRFAASPIDRTGHALPGKVRVAGRWAAGLVLSGLIALSTASTAQAAEIVVNSNLDPAGNTSQCTLREAIQSANGDTAIGGCAAGSSADRISFNTPGAGVKTITVASPLPEITAPLTIDGYTQPGSRANSQAVGSDAVILIELRGQGIDGAGLVLSNHAGSRIQGLAIRNFGREGIRIIGGSQHFVGGNFIGTDASGTVDQGNGFDGIRIEEGSTVNIIGGALVPNRNVISGNAGNGVRINGLETRNTIVTNNYI